MNRYNCFDVIFNNHIAQIILNRPEKRNSMTTDFWNEFSKYLQGKETSIRGILLPKTNIKLKAMQSGFLQIINTEPIKKSFGKKANIGLI